MISGSRIAWPKPFRYPRAASHRLQRARGYFDRTHWDGARFSIKGWLFLLDRPLTRVEVLLDGEPAGETDLYDRDDIAGAFTDKKWSRRSGFTLDLPIDRDRLLPWVTIDVIGYDGNEAVAILSTIFAPYLQEFLPTPPVKLMRRVANTEDQQHFTLAGVAHLWDFLKAIEEHRGMHEGDRILDWGCGCGRFSRLLLNGLTHAGTSLQGCDIDEEAVEWCRENLRGGTFTAIDTVPPMPYEDESFDIILGYSIFTHLTEDLQALWLQELERILAPGGIALVSVHGEFAASFSSDERVARDLRDKGVHDTSADQALDGVAPEGYYRSVYQTRGYTQQTWKQWIEVVGYIERGAGNYQDLVVLRKGTSPRPQGSRSVTLEQARERWASVRVPETAAVDPAEESLRRDAEQLQEAIAELARSQAEGSDVDLVAERRRLLADFGPETRKAVVRLLARLNREAATRGVEGPSNRNGEVP